MSSIIGNKIKVSVFGQSHAKAIGVTIDGFPAGFEIDMDELGRFMERRAPGRNAFSTARKEADLPEFITGVLGNVTCGAPVSALIYNKDQHSKDYENLKKVPRPGHADYTAQVKYGGFQDVAGGGHFSGRMMAPVCIAGSMCLQYLKKQGIEVYAHIKSIGGVSDDSVDMADCTQEMLANVKTKEFPVINDDKGMEMQEVIAKAKADLDSVGGVVECVITGVPAGIGEPMFDGIENRLAQALFGIPAVKGLEFGNGFEAALLRGSENNDSFAVKDNKVVTKTNNHGGILGGITSGMPIVFRVAIKPTPSIARQQESVRLETLTEELLEIKGRHDPCIVPRAVPCVEAVAAIVMMDVIQAGEHGF
ncbi:MAG: chorismate synthase [Lachnospiraceae bacterium]|nr:chorismate synthase [Lachnospiraceae bacterium]